ncbi:hypothetical protein GCM10010145_60580 [Streptomyces ruber]|uniref:Uncharacterized protein n=2 Tax=Streptomyces TaxID=1883 RepID=A0A918BQV7_9ACTN|nr:hypothetical protein [Streptomyces ruber]GGQ82834.1 hypothetical protein GCM10010145_60580 [Streptomyces ruber]
MEERRSRRGDRAEGRCKACGSRPVVPDPDGTMLCGHCAAALELPDASGLVEDEGAAVRRAFEHRDVRPGRRSGTDGRHQSCSVPSRRRFTGR